MCPVVDDLHLEDEILDAIFRAARGKLARAAERAAESWIRQLELANDGLRANHLPAKDLLTHTGIIDVAAPKKDTADQITVQIGGLTLDDLEVEEPPEPGTVE